MNTQNELLMGAAREDITPKIGSRIVFRKRPGWPDGDGIKRYFIEEYFQEAILVSMT